MNLCDAAKNVDDALYDIDGEISWLTALSPTGNRERWEAFRDSGFRHAPKLTYAELTCDPDALRKRLSALPVDEIEEPRIAALLAEKVRELDTQLDLIKLREKDGFASVSISLFGAPNPALLAKARTILDEVAPCPEPERDADAFDLARAAARARSRYQKEVPDFDFEINVEADINSALMVSQGDLYIDADTEVPRDRIAALVAHEVGIHVVTRYNGRQQPLRQLEAGLADYDALQEGLAVLAEWIAGCLPARRLRILAGRVVAAHAALQGETLEQVFAILHEEHGVHPLPAFDTAVRALRGGGMSKDAVYLEGLSELLAYLRDGGDIRPLLAGKIALSHLPILEALREEGLVREPAILPHHLTEEGADARLQAARNTPLETFFTEGTAE